MSSKWRGFLAHLGPYVIVIGILGFINLMTSDYPWVLWPALGWGVGLAFHLFSIMLDSMKNMSEKWHAFLGHFGSYIIIIGMLGAINLFTGGDIWFHWPALGWGAAVAIHLWTAIVGDDTDTGKAEVEDEQAEPELGDVKADLSRYVTRKQPTITDETLQSHLDRAHSYKEQIDDLIKATNKQSIQTRLQDLEAQLDDWTRAIEALARRVDNFQRNTLIHQDLESVPQSIEKLEAALASETDEATRTELRRTLTNRENQLAALEKLRGTMKRAEIKIESTLSALGTIYPQLLTSQSTDQVADYSRLSAEVDEEVRTLQDHLEALEEVKLGRVIEDYP